MSAHVVVPVEPCGKRWRCPDYQHRVDCLGCLGDGTRAVLDDAVPVKPLPERLGGWQEVTR